MFANTQHCWQYNVTYPPVNQSFQFQLFYLNKKKHWRCTEIVKFHSVVRQRKSFRTLGLRDIFLPYKGSQN